ncbi:hypothetical protein [Microvirga sp. VF16]|uniref:hypothetical protein n=1 Tax=Microvirga sp. VF16 TaxID=2807101 RepID=UPI00193D4998|nr:hypothetical protein [Microvirga sp. VF16]QRM34661.1 hypothetical protein JO965_40965 [Microvirga sp. VF16]
MINRPVRPTVKLTGAPFEAEGAQQLNRRKRRIAAGRLRRAGILEDPLTTFLRSRRGALCLLAGVLLLAAALYGLYLGKM